MIAIPLMKRLSGIVASRPFNPYDYSSDWHRQMFELIARDLLGRLR